MATLAGALFQEAIEQRLAEVAKRLNVSAADLAAAAIRDLLAGTDEEFSRIATSILEKNRELYWRLLP